MQNNNQRIWRMRGMKLSTLGENTYWNSAFSETKRLWRMRTMKQSALEENAYAQVYKAKNINLSLSQRIFDQNQKMFNHTF
jgi:hypothetical protein